MRSRIRDLLLERDEAAWNAALEAKEKLPAKYKEYVTYVKKLPSRFATNGLRQTLAFLNSKRKQTDSNPEGLLYKHLGNWIKKTVYRLDETNAEDILAVIRAGDFDRYSRAMAEASEFVTWLKLHGSSLATDPPARDNPSGIEESSENNQPTETDNSTDKTTGDNK